MSITETKLFKNRVESPELVTNTITSEHIHAESAIINGIEISPELFKSEDIQVSSVVDVKQELIANGNNPTSAVGEQILGFSMNIYGRFPNGLDTLNYVTLRRCDDNGNPVAWQTPVYMYIRCLDRDGNIIDTFFSK